MKKLITLLLGVCMCTFVMAQRPSAEIAKAGAVKPVIDGVIDEVWKDVAQNDVDKQYRFEAFTLGDPGTTYFKALWDEAGMYILVVVNDDQWRPWWGTTDGKYLYDKVELYFDTNSILNDGLGGQEGATGNRLIGPDPVEGSVNGELLTKTVLGGDVKYAYKVDALGSWNVEYFIPWESIPDKDGNLFEKNGTMGFDVDISDRDPGDTGRRRAMWANIGAIDENYGNMDDAGYLTFLGVNESISIDAITITAGADITTDNGTSQMTAAILPANATQLIKWVITGGTGSALINKDGVLTGVKDGTITLKAKSADDWVESNEVTVTVSGQKPTHIETSIIKDGDFVKGIGTTPGPDWSQNVVIVDGIAQCSNPTVGTVPWDWMFSQMITIPYADKDLNYIFSFKAWADEARPFTIDIEDVANGYVRFGSTSDASSNNGTSEWTFDLTNEPTVYTLHVSFPGMLTTASQKMNVMLGMATPKVYLDSIFLVNEADFALSSKQLNAPSNSMSVYPNPVGDANQLTVSLTATNAKVAIYNSIGQKLMEKVTTGNIAKFNVSSLSKGIYIVKLSDGTSQKFIK